MVGIIINRNEALLKIMIVGTAVVSVDGRDGLGMTRYPNGLENMHNLMNTYCQKDVKRVDKTYGSSDHSNGDQGNAAFEQLLPAERVL